MHTHGMRRSGVRHTTYHHILMLQEPHGDARVHSDPRPKSCWTIKPRLLALTRMRLVSVGQAGSPISWACVGCLELGCTIRPILNKVLTVAGHLHCTPCLLLQCTCNPTPHLFNTNLDHHCNQLRSCTQQGKYQQCIARTSAPVSPRITRGCAV